MVELGYDEASPFTSPNQSEGTTRESKDHKSSKAAQHKQPVTVKKRLNCILKMSSFAQPSTLVHFAMQMDTLLYAMINTSVECLTEVSA